ncbi:MAG: hypothetical protein LBV02_00255 [Bacteroidales bacterium]|jgi:hypothetical protein|nr:hypothetical protein [Bacteroidales bacterium]
MKKSILSLVLVAFILNGCRYEEGVLNFQSPENRLVAELWILSHVLKDGVEITEVPNDALKINNYYTFYYGGPMSVVTYTETGQLIENTHGEWAFENKYKKIHIYFILRNKRYTYTARIVKLSAKEFKYRYTDDDGVEWTLEFYKG